MFHSNIQEKTIYHQEIKIMLWILFQDYIFFRYNLLQIENSKLFKISYNNT